MKYGKLIARHNTAQSHWELNELLVELERIDVDVVLEIGMHRGGSARVWRDALQPKLLIGINERDELDDGRDLIGASVIFGRSQDPKTYGIVLGLWEHRCRRSHPIDFLFIDGGHLYAEVARDFELYAPLVRPGGLICFHDAKVTTNPACEVHLLWEQIRVGRRSKLIWDGTEAGTGEGLLFP